MTVAMCAGVSRVMRENIWDREVDKLPIRERVMAFAFSADSAKGCTAVQHNVDANKPANEQVVVGWGCAVAHPKSTRWSRVGQDPARAHSSKRTPRAPLERSRRLLACTPQRRGRTGSCSSSSSSSSSSISSSRKPERHSQLKSLKVSAKSFAVHAVREDEPSTF
jgi:hypothetical protein